MDNSYELCGRMGTKEGKMNNYTYEFEKILFFWKCKRIHLLGWTSGIGYGLTKNSARKRVLK